MSNDLVVVLGRRDNINRMCFQAMLRPYGVTVIECDSVFSVLEVLKIHFVHCILIDVSVPDFTGIELIGGILSVSKYARIKIIAYVFGNRLYDLGGVMNLGFHQLLVNPFSINCLLIAIGFNSIHVGRGYDFQ